MEAGSNTSTVTLRVVGDDEKGSLESETVKYNHESHGTWTPKMTALARARTNSILQTYPVRMTIIKIWS
jgi:hypothetical protein